ncbi:VWA domain-containing protein [Pelagicoccus sp. SDUM812005]|uniref:VWA domain-containing protein n=1 Tax=Pelagicoccus sp. SDUM812005 TaxID=3041257 RepID=UPI00280DE8FA|nr:VWA domain-containing protein [Pelagicoccus sp. SDUM812005]MDQ8183574.1 VWA domain-containing protein [Pelagicoccus sp. SDUM812005]
MSEFTFQWPGMLGLLLGVPALFWLLRRARIKRRLARQQWGQAESRPVGEKREFLWIASFAILVIALARPSYDPVRHSISNTGRDVVFVLDVSRSMLAQDAYPSRLESAKQGIADCLDRFESEQVGLVIYAGSASISCPLTADYDFVRYMLSQVQPRSVEFGGSFLLSAVEKVTDQVLAAERAGFQDVVVLTDGEDHAPSLDQVVERVRESGVELLVVGIGDPQLGATIPVESEDGSPASLRHEGETVYTTQEQEALQGLAKACPGGEYVNVGTDPYQLGEIYQDFAQGKASSALDGDAGYTVYREGAFFLMPLAFVLVVLAHPTFGRGAFRNLGLALLFGLGSAGNDLSGEDQEFSYEAAAASYAEGRYEDAAMAFAGLLPAESKLPARAALSFNLGLSQLKYAEGLRDAAPRDALAYALEARESFLQAARENPQLLRAKQRLGQLVEVIGELEAIVAEEAEKERQENDALEALLERIEALLVAQQELRSANAAEDPLRGAGARSRKGASAEAAMEPANGKQRSRELSEAQGASREEGERIQKLMRELNALLLERANSDPTATAAETLLSRPLVLMQQAIDGQETAEALFAEWKNWPEARERQVTVEQRLQEILDLFASSESEEGEDGDWEDYEDFEMGEEGEGMPSSMGMEGEFRADAHMQALPLPNYSPEEILSEEMGSQQFRQEQRAKANAGEVEKDW